MQMAQTAVAFLTTAMLAGPALAVDIVVTTTNLVVDVTDSAGTLIEPRYPNTQVYPAPFNVGALQNPVQNPDLEVSLSEAIIAANNTPGSDTIVLEPGQVYGGTTGNFWHGPTMLPPRHQ